MILIRKNWIGFKHWHHYFPEHGTGIRWMKSSLKLFGVLHMNSGIYLGLWWTIRIELLAVHNTLFNKKTK